MERPAVNKDIVDYEFFKTFDLAGKFYTGSLNYGTQLFENVSADVAINQGIIKITNLQATKEGGNISGQTDLDITTMPKIKGSLNFANFNPTMLGGKKYGFVSGLLRAKTEFESSAESEADFIERLTGKISFDIDNAVFKGWDMEFIEDDLSRRTHSDNLIEMLRDNLQKGQTAFELVGAEIDIKNSNYTFKDALMASGLVTIDVAGSGSLKNWDTDTTFKIVFERLRDKLVPIEFKWNGSLSNPNLIVDGSDLKNKYDSYWEKIAQEKKAAEEARIKALNEKMSKTQEKVSQLKETAVNEILPRIEKYKPLSSNAEIKSRYDSNHLLVIDINNQLEMMQQKAKVDFNDDDITEMNAKLETFEPQLQEILKQIDETFIYDVKVHAASAYGTIAGIYDNSKIKAINYQKTLDAYVLRLLQLGSLVVLDRDPRATDYKNQIETSLRTLEDLNLKANETRETIEATDNIDELDKQYKVMQELLGKTQEELEKLNSGMETLFDYAKKLVRKEEYGDMPAEKAEPKNEIIIVEEDSNNEKTDEEPMADAPQSQPLLKPTEEKAENISFESNAPAQTKPVEVFVSDKQTETPAEIISYQSKSVLSGTITRGKQILEAEKPAVVVTPATGTVLLRPISERTVPSGGIIKKKK